MMEGVLTLISLCWPGEDRSWSSPAAPRCLPHPGSHSGWTNCNYIYDLGKYFYNVTHVIPDTDYRVTMEMYNVGCLISK